MLLKTCYNKSTMPKISQDFVFFLCLCGLVVVGFSSYKAIYPHYVEYRLALMDIKQDRVPTNISTIALKLQSETRMLKNLAKQLEAKNWNAQAIVVLTSAFFVAPKEKDIVVALAGLLWEEGKEIEALSVVETALGKGLPFKDGLEEMYIGLCVTQARYTKAVHLANLSEQTPTIKYWRAIAFHGLKEYNKAGEELRRLLVIDPGNHMYRISYARTLISEANERYSKPVTLASK